MFSQSHTCLHSTYQISAQRGPKIAEKERWEARLISVSGKVEQGCVRLHTSPRKQKCGREDV